MHRTLNILLADDDPVDVMTVRRSFRKNALPHPLFVVGNGEEVLAFLRHQPPYQDAAACPRPDMILLDLNMPLLGGQDTLRALKLDPDLRTIPVVVLTTSQQESDRFESFNLGAAGYIIKPVDFDKFSQAIHVIEQYWSLSERPQEHRP